MIIEPIRLLLAWLTDPVTGLNAQLPNVPRPGGEDPPPTVTIYNELDHAWVARNIIHRDALTNGPAVIVRFPELDPQASVRQPVLPTEGFNGRAPSPVAVYYARRKLAGQVAPASSAVQVRDARQSLRVVSRVIAQHVDGPHTEFTQDGCDISLDPAGLELTGRYIDAGDDEVLDVALVPFLVLDRWALGII